MWYVPLVFLGLGQTPKVCRWAMVIEPQMRRNVCCLTPCSFFLSIHITCSSWVTFCNNISNSHYGLLIYNCPLTFNSILLIIVLKAKLLYSAIFSVISDQHATTPTTHLCGQSFSNKNGSNIPWTSCHLCA